MAKFYSSKMYFLSSLKRLEDVPETSRGSKAKSFFVEMKKTLSEVHFNQVMKALQGYKASDDLQALLEATTFLSEDRCTHSLLRGGCSARPLEHLLRNPGDHLWTQETQETQTQRGCSPDPQEEQTDSVSPA